MKTETVAILVGAGLIAAYYISKKGLAAVANVNAGTPYAGSGPIGTLGHAADALSGGNLSSGGADLGGWLYNLVTPAYDPNAGATLPNWGVTGNWNDPAGAGPGIIMPTQKSAVADNYWNSNLPSVFTPGP